MDATDRAQALHPGQAMSTEYGDALTKLRMEQQMRRAVAATTGSRLGFTRDRIEFAKVELKPGGPAIGGAMNEAGLSAKDYDADERWDASAYWKEHDRQWNAKVLAGSPVQTRDESP